MDSLLFSVTISERKSIVVVPIDYPNPDVKSGIPAAKLASQETDSKSVTRSDPKEPEESPMTRSNPKVPEESPMTQYVPNVPEEFPITQCYTPPVFNLENAASEFLFLSGLPTWLSAEEIFERFEISVGEVDYEQSSLIYDLNSVYTNNMTIAFKHPSDARHGYLKTVQGMWIWGSTQGFKINASYHVSRQRHEDNLNVTTAGSEALFDPTWTHYQHNYFYPDEVCVVEPARKEVPQTTSSWHSPASPLACKIPKAVHNQRKFLPVFPTILEDMEGEACMAELDNVTGQLKLEKEKNEQLQKQVSLLLYEGQHAHPEKELTPTRDLGCGPDTVLIAVDKSTQTYELTSESGSGDISPKLGEQDEISTEESYGFQLDLQMVEVFSNKTFPYRFPDYDRPDKSPVVIQERETVSNTTTAMDCEGNGPDLKMMEQYTKKEFPYHFSESILQPKSVVIVPQIPEEIHYQGSDFRYRNKPINGYVVNLLDGTTQTYGDASSATSTRPALDSNIPTTIVPNGKTTSFKFLEKLFPAPASKPNPVPKRTDSFVIRNEVVVTKFEFTEELSNIGVNHFGRILGKEGKQVEELRKKFGVEVAVSQQEDSTDRIKVEISSGSDASSRHAAAQHILEQLPVKVDVKFAFGSLSQNEKSCSYVSFPHVQIKYAGQPGRYVFCGRLKECRMAFDKLKIRR